MEQEDDFTLQLLRVSDEYEAGDYSFRDEKPMISGNDRGRAQLRFENVKLRRGELYVAEFTFYSTNCSYWVYNPFFGGLISSPGQLAIYDAEKKYVGELKYDTISHRSPSDADWVYLYAGGYIGTKIGFRAGYLPGTEFCHMGNLLPAGRYYIQVILYKAFLTHKDRYFRGDFSITFDRSELCRSNAVEVELID
jgi:hypothetical protein